MTLNRIMKRHVDKTYTGYDYTYDGAYDPLVKGHDKKRRQRDSRRFLKKQTTKEIREETE